ncbi:hypothetical protein [Haloarchaeobius amylolyticus]|uniref:hypothetical protein n=1 Tax=Haloarchaeobius amylolyticus TaxID=1198296 RepID=UPI00226E1451|nr:hypothetical protein [Haloarchaeobius amylolyticus]
MSKERERQEQPRAVADAVVLTVFDDAAPRTATEVAAETDIGPEAAADILDGLAEAGDLRAKELTDGEATLTAYYTPASLHGTASSADPETAREDAVEEAVAEMDVPGVSEMMIDWRRDAIQAAWDHLADEGTVTDREFKHEVFPKYRAGYDDAEAWWSFVRPRLPRLPGVSGPGEDGSTWEYLPA